jgi:acyl-coenzyme A thioesterase PaaI-like protein
MADSVRPPQHRPDPVAGSAEPAVEHSSPARFATALILRRLAHSLVAHQVDDELLARIERSASELVAEVETADPRPNALLMGGPRAFLDTTDGSNVGFPDGLVTGRANPMGFGAVMRREGDEAVLAVTLGAAFEGAPGRAHGGVVATLIDETMGMVLHIVGTPAFTGRLTVNYRAPTPLHQPLEARSRLAHRDGRKLTITAELRQGDVLLADADSVFIAVEPERFFPSAG